MEWSQLTFAFAVLYELRLATFFNPFPAGIVNSYSPTLPATELGAEFQSREAIGRLCWWHCICVFRQFSSLCENQT